MEWHRSEPEEMFARFLQAGDTLVLIWNPLFKGGEISRDKAFDIHEADFHKLEPTIFPELAATDAWMPKELANEIVLLIIVRQSFLKRSSIVDGIR